MASTLRPISTAELARLTAAGSLLNMAAGVTAVIMSLTVPDLLACPRLVLVAGSVVLGAGIAGLLLAPALSIAEKLSEEPPSSRGLVRLAPALFFWALLLVPLFALAGVVGMGPRFAAVVALLVEAPLFAFYVMRRPWALVVLGEAVVGFALVVTLQDGWAAPLAQGLILTATVVATAVVMGMITERSARLAVSERQARVALADLNHSLEARVEVQVSEIERLGQLRRFLSPQVADAVLSGASDEITRPHRRRIAVFLCDLRGFTAFTNHAEPEDVIGVLDEYYGAVGGLLLRYDATVGDYAGDGIMAYFGDPVPREEAAMAAVAMTKEIASVMGPLVEEWRHRGHDLDYGVGLAFGYATLGVVGFDGRYDYKPVGGVVNLAARLCSRAGPGQVLLDQATHAATSGEYPSEQIPDLELKGYGAAQRAYTLT